MTSTEIPATRRSESTSEFSQWNPSRESAEIENPQNDNDEELHSDELQGVLDWLQEFKHGLVDESVLEHRKASSSSHELPLEPRAKVVSGKHNIVTQFPKDPNCNFLVYTSFPQPRLIGCINRNVSGSHVVFCFVANVPPDVKKCSTERCPVHSCETFDNQFFFL